MPPAEGIIRIRDESGLGSYSYIQFAHVEVSDDVITRLANGDKTIRVDIHEHINRYTVKSVTGLLRSTGVSSVTVETEVVDLGWIKATVIRALGRKL